MVLPRLLSCILILISSTYATAKAGDNESNASRHLQRALTALPEVKQATKKAERAVLKFTGIDKKDIVYMAPVLWLFTGEIDTGIIPNMAIKAKEGKIIPKLNIDARRGESNASVVYLLTF